MLLIWRSLDLRLPDHLMFWAACSLGCFGFLRASEFTVPSLASFSPSLHLGVQDIALDSLSAPLCIRLKIKGSKTDPFRKGAFIHIGRGRPPLCAVHSVISYLASRGDRSVLEVYLGSGGSRSPCSRVPPFSKNLERGYLWVVSASRVAMDTSPSAYGFCSR